MNFTTSLEINSAFTSCGCNRTPNSVHWGSTGLVLYAATNGVIIAEQLPDASFYVKAAEASHSNRVNCVRWIESPFDDVQLDVYSFISGGVDRLLNVYSFETSSKQITLNKSLKHFEGSIVCCDGVRDSQGATLIAAASGDSKLNIYRFLNQGQDECDPIQSIKFGTGFVLAVHLSFLPKNANPILACGGDDMKVYLFSFSNEDGQFIELMTLQGHDDWIRGVEFATDAAGDVLLASCSQDNSIRVWRIKEKVETAETDKNEDELQVKEKLFRLTDNAGEQTIYSVAIETVLFGHESWVYGIHWKPSVLTSRPDQSMQLLSASMDKTMIIWEPDKETASVFPHIFEGVWEERLRVGQVGGNTLGLYGCQYSPNGTTILAHGYQGAFTVWNQTSNEGFQWEQGVIIGGHFDDVTDLSWDPQGHFIITTSIDQTTRLFAPWKGGLWYEMGRPQVHGYNIQCMAMLNRFSFASGADEKVIRLFNAPMNFLENLQRLLDVDLSVDIKERKLRGGVAQGASVPALGLSNKAVYNDKTTNVYEDREITPSDNKQYSETAFTSLQLSKPPSEDNLLQNTLWPEVQKLYGHGFEIISLAANPQGNRLASACKASKSEHACIIVWSVPDYVQLTSLSCHSLTVVQMSFSHDGRYLLAVSRDRTWSLHHFDYESGDIQLAAHSDKKTSVHSRIIWSCCWSHDDKYFATGSRDKKVVLWTRETGGDSVSPSPLNGYAACSQHAFSHSVTAVSMSPTLDVRNKYLMAAGFESGEITLCAWNLVDGFSLLKHLDTSFAHHLSVRRLKFNPVLKQIDNKAAASRCRLQLASCSEDHYVKVYDILVCNDEPNN